MIPAWVGPIALAGWFVALMLLEQARPLRATVASKPVRVARNVALGALSFGILAAVQPHALDWTTRFVGAHELAWMRQRTGWPPGSRIVLSFLFLDLTLWIWHWANHKVPFLWRFHLVHHVDRDLDASTALRFHFGEFTLSIGFRAVQFALIGGDLALLAAWQSAVFACVLFHHSNLRLPEKVDRWLSFLIVTPRMHGIHHSKVHAETDSNWSSLLSMWDRLFGTFRDDVPQDRIEIGVPAHASERDVELAHILVLPFERQRDDWLER